MAQCEQCTDKQRKPTVCGEAQRNGALGTICTEGKISLQVLQLMVHLLHPSENFKEVMDFEGSLPDAKVESTGKVCSYRWAMNVQPDETTKYSPDETDFRTPEVCALALVVAMHNHDLVSIEEFIF